jgi:hypothetical protein
MKMLLQTVRWARYDQGDAITCSCFGPFVSPHPDYRSTRHASLASRLVESNSLKCSAGARAISGVGVSLRRVAA